MLALRDATVDGRLTLAEFSERIESAYAAGTRGELERITHDLPAPTRAPRKRTKRLTFAFFGGADRKGRWRVPRRGLVLALFGGADLDLRQAELDAPAVSLVSISLFGGTDVYVPEGVEVDLRGFAIFGGNDEHGVEGHLSLASPLLRLYVFSLFGGFDLWRVPREAKGRRKELRRAARNREADEPSMVRSELGPGERALGEGRGTR